MEKVCSPAKQETVPFEEAFENFLFVVKEKVATYYAEKFPTLIPDTIDYKAGRRYIKIIKNRGGSGGRSVYCFVDKTNGDILKAASWKAPAKHARGNIFDEDWGASSVNEHGANYLR